MAIPGLSNRQMLGSMQLFGEEVLPMVEKKPGKPVDIGVLLTAKRCRAA
jgi:hypothetical protein